MEKLEELEAFLREPKKIIITTHARPDADALGSSLGLFHFLKGRGHDVTVMTPTDYPEFLHWMEGNDEVLIYDPGIHARCAEMIAQVDLICCLDFSGLDRIKALGSLVGETAAKKLLVDHHLNPEDFADFALWDNQAAATAELIYDLMLMLGGKNEITKAIAECLYAGIMTDTGSFKFSSTSSKIHRTVAELIDMGVEVNKVHRKVYDNNSINRLRFIGYALAENLKVDTKNSVGYFVISRNEYQRFQLRSGDTEGLVNYALSIKGINVAAIIMEREEEVRLSFRSVGDYSVNDFAEEHFGGGGHKNAAGGMSKGSLKETLDKFVALIPVLSQKKKLVTR